MTQFTLLVAAIQATIMENFGYEISYQMTLVVKHKTLTILFRDFHKSYAKLSRFFMALEQANPRCVVTWKTFDGHMPRYFNSFSGHFIHLLKDSTIVCPY